MPPKSRENNHYEASRATSYYSTSSDQNANTKKIAEFLVNSYCKATEN